MHEQILWKREADFFDRQAAARAGLVGRIDPRTLRRYGAPTLRDRFARELRLKAVGPLRGLRVLDVGCGEGQDSVLLAKLGAAEVVGLDLSPGAIELAASRARVNGVADRVRFVCAPVEHAELPEGSFDVVWCNAILHHVTGALDEVVGRLRRWARPDGQLSFSEPVNLWPLLRRARALVPYRRGEYTPDERPLEPADLAVVAKHVEAMQVRLFGALGRLDQLVLPDFNYERAAAWRRGVVNLTAGLDRVLLAAGPLARLASVAVFWGRPAPAAAEVVGATAAPRTVTG